MPIGPFPYVTVHGVEHHIVTTGPPIAFKFGCLESEKLLAAKAKFKQLKADGIIRKSTSFWSSPLHMVKKVDSSVPSSRAEIFAA
jgi:hypothetical protein